MTRVLGAEAMPDANAENEYRECSSCGKTVNARALVGGRCRACRMEPVVAEPVREPGRELPTIAPRKCVICGGPLPRRRVKYCSPECRDEGKRALKRKAYYEKKRREMWNGQD